MAEITRYVTPVFRGSFPSLFVATAMDEKAKKKFGITAVWTPAKFTVSDKKRWKAIMAALDAECMAKFRKHWKDLPANFKTGVRDGAEKADLEGFGDGTLFANLGTMMRPGVIDAEKNRIGPEQGNEDDIYPGCYCRATVTVYSFDNVSKGVALGLMNVQKVADGERLDSRTDAEEDFEDDIDQSWLDQDDEAVDPLDD